MSDCHFECGGTRSTVACSCTVPNHESLTYTHEEIIACVCVCELPHIVIQRTQRSPWRQVTYNPDVAVCFWQPGVLRKGGGGLFDFHFELEFSVLVSSFLIYKFIHFTFILTQRCVQVKTNWVVIHKKLRCLIVS